MTRIRAPATQAADRDEAENGPRGRTTSARDRGVNGDAPHRVWVAIFRTGPCLTRAKRKGTAR